MSSLLVLWLSASALPASAAPTSGLPTPGAAALDRACLPATGAEATVSPCDLQLELPTGRLLLARGGGGAREPWGYYLGWGIADWSIAGGMWTGAAYFGIIGSVFLFSATSGARPLGAMMVIGSAGLGIGGIFVAQHAAANIEMYHRIRGR